MKNNKSLGQHWLKNREILDTIADLALPVGEAANLCIEIGPGLGTLTSSLLRRFDRVIAIEYDERLAGNLPASFPGKNLEVIHGDILQTDLDELIKTPTFSIAGNIPYYITSPIIRKLLELSHKPARIALLIQKEVAERIAAEPGSMSLISLFAQNLAEVSLGPVVPAVEFTPPPKVDSQVIILEPRSEPVIDPVCLDLAKIGFSSPRKKLVHNLVAGTKVPRERWLDIFAEQGISPDARAEDLDLYDWENIQSVL